MQTAAHNVEVHYPHEQCCNHKQINNLSPQRPVPGRKNGNSVAEHLVFGVAKGVNLAHLERITARRQGVVAYLMTLAVKVLPRAVDAFKAIGVHAGLLSGEGKVGQLERHVVLCGGERHFRQIRRAALFGHERLAVDHHARHEHVAVLPLLIHASSGNAHHSVVAAKQNAMRHAVVTDGKRTESGHSEAHGASVGTQYAAVVAHDSPHIVLHPTQHGGGVAAISGYVIGTAVFGIHAEAAYLAVHCRPDVALTVDSEVVNDAVFGDDVLHTHRLGVDTVESAVVHSHPDASASVLDELPHVYALQLRE